MDKPCKSRAYVESEKLLTKIDELLKVEEQQVKETKKILGEDGKKQTKSKTRKSPSRTRIVKASDPES